jgi:hypothetical protein
MQVHYSCSKKVEAMGAGVKIEYMTWWVESPHSLTQLKY